MTNAPRIRRLPLTLAAITLTVPLAGCDWISGSTSSTKLENVEIQPGTASDEMITLDQASGDATAVDPSTAVAPPAPGSPSSDSSTSGADGAGDATASDSAATAGGTQPGDQVIAPPSGGAEPTRPAAASTGASRTTGGR